MKENTESATFTISLLAAALLELLYSSSFAVQYLVQATQQRDHI